MKERKKGREKKRKEKDRIRKKNDERTGAHVVKCLVDRNCYFFSFYNVQSHA